MKIETPRTPLFRLGLIACAGGAIGCIAAGLTSQPRAHASEAAWVTHEAYAAPVAQPDPHGNDGPFALSLRPTRSLTDPQGRARLEYEYAVAPNTDRRSSVQVAYEIARATGELISSSQLPPADLHGKNQRHTGKVLLPFALSDGYFVLRAKAAGASAENSATMLAEEYFLVSKGSVSPISLEQWHAESGINVGHTIPSDKQPSSAEEARALYGAPASAAAP